MKRNVWKDSLLIKYLLIFLRLQNNFAVQRKQKTKKLQILYISVIAVATVAVALGKQMTDDNVCDIMMNLSMFSVGLANASERELFSYYI